MAKELLSGLLLREVHFLKKYASGGTFDLIWFVNNRAYERKQFRLRGSGSQLSKTAMNTGNSSNQTTLVKAIIGWNWNCVTVLIYAGESPDIPGGADGLTARDRVPDIILFLEAESGAMELLKGPKKCCRYWFGHSTIHGDLYKPPHMMRLKFMLLELITLYR